MSRAATKAEMATELAALRAENSRLTVQLDIGRAKYAELRTAYRALASVPQRTTSNWVSGRRPARTVATAQ